jgi:hypothetical protein
MPAAVQEPLPMKLAAAAAAVADSAPDRPRRPFLLFAVLLMVLAAAPVAALDAIDLSVPAEAPAEGECPALIKIKYPFLSCADGRIGMTSEDDTWMNSRRIPLGSQWVEGNGFWGPNRNDPYVEDAKAAKEADDADRYDYDL